MDKYIRVLLIQLNIKYEKATITTIQSYNKEFKTISSFYKLSIKKRNKKNKKVYESYSIDCNSKRQLILEMVNELNKE